MTKHLGYCALSVAVFLLMPRSAVAQATCMGLPSIAIPPAAVSLPTRR